jgi:cystathionine gamma-synthase
MDRHSASGEQIARHLAEHPRVEQVYYPGLPSHAGFDVAKRQMRAFGGVVSFRVKGGADAARAVCDRARLFTLAESLGGVESLIELPSTMTHASVAESELAVPVDLIRLSVGLETVGDLIADLDAALDL